MRDKLSVRQSIGYELSIGDEAVIKVEGSRLRTAPNLSFESVITRLTADDKVQILEGGNFSSGYRWYKV